MTRREPPVKSEVTWRLYRDLLAWSLYDSWPVSTCPSHTPTFWILFELRLLGWNRDELCEELWIYGGGLYVDFLKKTICISKKKKNYFIKNKNSYEFETNLLQNRFIKRESFKHLVKYWHFVLLTYWREKNPHFH